MSRQREGRAPGGSGSDCGFATFASFLAVEPDIVWAKLHAMAEGAALASKELY